MSYKKVGGVRFIKVGRLSMSFCMTKPAPRSATPSGEKLTWCMLTALAFVVPCAWVYIVAY